MSSHVSESEAMREAAAAAFKAEEEQQQVHNTTEMPQTLQQWMTDNNIENPAAKYGGDPGEKPRINMIFDHHDQDQK